MIPLARAQAIARKVVDSLRPFCTRIEIAGSIRREQPLVGDIDLVIQATDRTALAAIEARITERCTIAKAGQQNLVAEMPDKTQLDLWFAHAPNRAPEPELFPRPVSPTAQPYNFGTLLLCRTGSIAHNIALAERALKLGLRWNPHWGIYQDGLCIASASEEDIYAALKLDFIPPVERELADRNAQLRIIHGRGAHAPRVPFAAPPPQTSGTAQGIFTQAAAGALPEAQENAGIFHPDSPEDAAG